MKTFKPLVSVIMANRNGAAHVAVAVRSVLRSTLTSLELIVSDDGSTDDSVAIARAAAAGDDRLILLRSESGTGPAAARNRALKAARGTWVAIVDSDDFIHPERLERLIAAANSDDADIAADDLLTFYDGDTRAPHAHLRGAWAKRPHWVSAAEYERSNRMLGPGPAFGYLKPLFRRLGGTGITPTYDESLRIGEDADLVLRLLIAGWRLRLYPELGYFYRKHAGSVSHRLDAASLNAMAEAAGRIDPGADADLARELAAQKNALADAKAFGTMVEALKTRDLAGAAKAGLKRSGALWLLKEPIGARLFPKRANPERSAGPPRITLLSRQRIVGQTNGSSAYVLALAGALKTAGYAVDYLGPSPKTFGRWALMRLRPETDVFDSYRLRGGVRVGSVMLARDPGVWIASAFAVLARVLGKVGISATWSRPAEYAQGAAATRADMLYVARHAATNTHAILCDYAFTAPLAPYALRPEAPTFTIMHDLMSARISDKAETNTVELSAETEFRLLGLADGVIAIQRDEAAKVHAALPGTRIIVAPHAVTTASTPQPGADNTLLFVGSNTAPNVVGLDWFFREIWPAVREKRPLASLLVAGSVARGLGEPPEGVKMLGVVADLTPLYRDAGVVISPLFTGSGLKIKLIEALAAGKAVVGTTVTVQGVEDIVAGAMSRQDEPARFAAEVAALLGDAGKRTALARAALECARTHFSADACFAELVFNVRRSAVAPPQKPLQVEALQSQ